MATAAEGTTGQVDNLFADKYQAYASETTTARTVSASDIGKVIVCSNSSAVTVTIPESTTTAGKTFPIGSWFEVVSTGAAGVTVAKTGSDSLIASGAIATNGKKKVVKATATSWLVA